MPSIASVAPGRPFEAVLGDERLAAAVPGGLRVEQEAVEVEDDGPDQAGDQGIEPRPAVLETAILTVGPVPRRVCGAILARSVRQTHEQAFVILDGFIGRKC